MSFPPAHTAEHLLNQLMVRMFGCERSRNARTGLSAAAQKKSGASTTFAKGDQVDHKTFGRGVVVKVDGDTLYVKFSKLGETKKLLKDYAPIVKINTD